MSEDEGPEIRSRKRQRVAEADAADIQEIESGDDDCQIIEVKPVLWTNRERKLQKQAHTALSSVSASSALGSSSSSSASLPSDSLSVPPAYADDDSLFSWSSSFPSAISSTMAAAAASSNFSSASSSLSSSASLEMPSPLWDLASSSSSSSSSSFHQHRPSSSSTQPISRVSLASQASYVPPNRSRHRTDLSLQLSAKHASDILIPRTMEEMKTKWNATRRAPVAAAALGPWRSGGSHCSESAAAGVGNPVFVDSLLGAFPAAEMSLSSSQQRPPPDRSHHHKHKAPRSSSSFSSSSPPSSSSSSLFDDEELMRALKADYRFVSVSFPHFFFQQERMAMLSMHQ